MTMELGKYADTVLSTYAVSLALLIGLVVWTILRGQKIRKELRKIEERGHIDG
nr:heme exporter protein CcmD [Epibacterium ulvae]